jgi:orotidine-5'-phosphate decarboxylase
MEKDPKDHLCVSLEGLDPGQCWDLFSALAPEIKWIKVHDLLDRRWEGVDMLRYISRYHHLFVDMKIDDTPRTVFERVTRLVERGASHISVHISAGMESLRAAQEAARGRAHIIGITVLTSQSDEECEFNFGGPRKEVVPRFAGRAETLGLYGFTASGPDLPYVSKIDPTMKRIVPGIRRPGEDRGGHAQTMTPTEAIKAGGDLLVVGRSITHASDPRTACQTYLSEIKSALSA